jgi:pre-mRNA-splicing factor SPF27
VNEGVSIFASILIHLRYRLEKEIEQLQQQKDSINRQRKLSQESDGRTLQQMEQQYTALVAKNMEINMACQELESEVSELQEETGQSDASSHDT